MTHPASVSGFIASSSQMLGLHQKMQKTMSNQESVSRTRLVDVMIYPELARIFLHGLTVMAWVPDFVINFLSLRAYYSFA